MTNNIKKSIKKITKKILDLKIIINDFKMK